MNKFDELTQIMFEISMKIGVDLNLDQMLREVAMVTLRKLNASAFIVFEKRESQKKVSFEQVYATPQSFINHESYRALQQVIPSMITHSSLNNFYAGLPQDIALKEKGHFHLMNLPNYGLLALFRGRNGLPLDVVQSLDVLNKKLAFACLACLSYGHLEEQVRIRTKEIDDKNKELEAFTYSVSHDLKAPLRSITGFSGLLSKKYSDKLDGDGKLYLQYISDSADKLRQLIDDLLSYSRMERRDIDTTDIDLDALVKALLAERNHDITTNNVKVQVKLPFHSIKSDKFMLRQVLGNYIDNAIKFSQKTEHPVVEINGSENEKTWSIQVKDNGIGFEPQYQDRIFLMFQRLHSDNEFVGTGVGLAIVRKAVERMGGRVWAEGEPGKGATFYVDIPKRYHHQ